MWNIQSHKGRQCTILAILEDQTSRLFKLATEKVQASPPSFAIFDFSFGAVCNITENSRITFS